MSVLSKTTNVGRDLLERWTRYRTLGILGNGVRLDASTICQLRCPACLQSTGERGIVSRQFLPFEVFKQFVDKYPLIRSIELSNWGEIFLNPEIDSIVEYAYSKAIAVHAGNGANLNSIREETIENLVKFQFRSLLVSLDAATSETYSRYRIGGSFDRVIQNIRKINECKKKCHSTFPELTFSFVVFGHNAHELPAARKLAAELGMKFVTVYNHFDPAFAPATDAGLMVRETGYASFDEFEKKTGRVYPDVCFQMWFYPQIDSNGALLGCCHNRWGDYGNVFRDGLETCIRSEKYTYAKQMVLGTRPWRKDIPCHSCDIMRRAMHARIQNRLGQRKSLARQLPFRQYEELLLLRTFVESLQQRAWEVLKKPGHKGGVHVDAV